ncbi:MAG: hypothetical protein AAF539_06175 [Planctomycetota bacterium]
MYEVIDHSDEEMYYPMGCFDSVEEAAESIKSYFDRNQEPKTSWQNGGESDSVKIEVRKLPEGWGDPETVWVAEYTRSWIDELDDDSWVCDRCESVKPKQAA